MFPRIARIFAVFKRHHAQHAAPPPSASHPLHITHGPLEPLGRGHLEQRTFVTPPAGIDYRNPAPLAALRSFTASDGQTLLMHRIGDGPRPETPLPPSYIAETAVHDAVATARFADPTHWYGRDDGGWPDVPADPPTLVGTFNNPADQTPRELRNMRSGLAEAFGNSALTYKTSTLDEWFGDGKSLSETLDALKQQQEAQAAERDRAMVEFHKRAGLIVNGQVPVPRHAGVLDTSVFATVATSEFTDARTDRPEASA